MTPERAPPERALLFACAGHRLLGVISPGERTRGLLVVVGGPQYRVGSHRQFVQLARSLSADGFPVLRFDYRGLGDSEGPLRGFEYIADDIRAAVDALLAQQPQVREVVLWGLCDAASASILYAAGDARVCGVVMLNPWVRSAQSEARTWLRHYYLQRVLSRNFWSKFVRGGLDLTGSLRFLGGRARAALSGPATPAAAQDPTAGWRGGPLPTLPGLADRMARAFAAFPGRVLLVTSGQDLTAAEFLDVSRASKTWRRLLAQDRVTRRHLAEANHTFSQRPWKAQVEAWTREWLLAP